MNKFKTKYIDEKTGFTFNFSGMNINENEVKKLEKKLENAHLEMIKIENGEIKNPDENRKVTHFSDRLKYLESKVAIDVENFAKNVQKENILPNSKKVEYVVINGIGGSALGPQFLQFAINGAYWNELTLEKRDNYPRIYFLDNTDSAGISDLKQVVDFSKTIIVTISKSGGTLETANNLKALKQIYNQQKLDFSKYAVAITMEDSKLDKTAKTENWLKIFPMEESIGGRTSETNIVGHLPAVLTGINFKNFIEGAKHMDKITRNPDWNNNPAYQLATSWYITGNGKGDKNMVVVPYSDRLVLLAKYLQQLVMESLGKELDLDGNIVNQGLTVFGNKGGTDAHAYIQQLNDGRDDFFLTFIEVLKDAEQLIMADGVTMGDYLHAFKDGLVNALQDKQRKVMEITITQVNETNIGMIIALYERAVAYYAELININAFHQPGVQSYKLASDDIHEISQKIQAWIHAPRQEQNWQGTAKDIAREVGASLYINCVEGILSKYAENKRDFHGWKFTRKVINGEWVFSLT